MQHLQGTASDTSVSLAREVVDTGLWYLAEYEKEEFILNKNPSPFKPVRDFLYKQGRFRHLLEEDILLIEKKRDEKWKKIRNSWKI